MTPNGNRVLCGVTCSLGFVVTLIVFWPGFASPDSLRQLAEARAGQYFDWHPPLMSAFWGTLERVRPGTELMLLLQAAIYWIAAFLLLVPHVTAPTRRLLLALAMFVLPTSISFIGVIWKDVHMALAWTLAFSITYCTACAVQFGGRVPVFLKCVATLLVLYGALVRLNAFVATGPLLLAIWIGRPWLRSAWLTIVAWLAISCAVFGSYWVVTYRLLDAKRSGIELSLIIFDIAGVSVRSNANLFAAVFSHEQFDGIKKCYDARSVAPYFAGGPCSFVLERMNAQREAGHASAPAWISAIISHPGSYLAHRLAHMNSFLCIWDCWQARLSRADANWNLVERPELKNENLIYQAYRIYTYLAGWTPIAKPYVIYIFAAGLWLLAWRRSDGVGELIIGALASVVIYMSFFGIVSVADDGRYAYPAFLMLAACASVLVLGSRRNEVGALARRPMT
jgi:hypothetical protein